MNANLELRRLQVGQRLSRRSVMRVAAVAAGSLAVTAVGCRSRGRPAESGRSGASAGTPKSGGILKVPVRADPFDWDMSYAGKSDPNGYGVVMATESLLAFKSGPDVAYADLTVQPKLAEKWEVSPDGSKIVFHLRRGVKFASVAPVNERELTAADVKFSYEYASRTGEFAGKKLPIGFFAFMFEGLRQIETPDPYTAVVDFETPFVPFLSYAASNQNPILPREIFDQDGNFKTRLAGTGPYLLDSAQSQPGSRWAWRRNPQYWQQGRPYVDEIDWLVMRDEATAQAAFQAKQLDWIYALDSTTAATVAKGNPTATRFDYSNASAVHLYMQADRPPFSDLRVRKALSLSIDRDEFVRTLAGGKGAWALAGAFPDTFSQDEIEAMLRPNPDQARQLIRDAGYANGVEIEFLINPTYGPLHVHQAELLQAQAKRADINLLLKPIENTDYAQRKRDRKFTLMHTAKAVQSEIDSYLYSTFYPGLERNYTGVDDAKLTPLLVAQRRETDPSRRRDLVRAAVRYINTEGYWAASLYYDNTTEFCQPGLKGYAPSFGNQTAATDPPGWSPEIWLER
jgi:peptide/nickel transport system substrate-binding protein